MGLDYFILHLDQVSLCIFAWCMHYFHAACVSGEIQEWARHRSPVVEVDSDVDASETLPGSTKIQDGTDNS